LQKQKIDTGILLVVNGFLLLIVFGFGGYGLLELRELSRGQKSLNWQNTDGTITTSFVVQGSRDSSSKSLPTPFRGDRPRGVSTGGGGPTRSLYLTYTYIVQEKPYEGKRIRFGSMSPDPDRAVKLYPKGRTVTVYYDPDAPENSVLEQGTEKSTTTVLAVCGGVITLCILGGLLFWLFMIRYKKSLLKRKKSASKPTEQQKQHTTLTIYMGGASILCSLIPVL
jgi:hypothetical protein